MPIKTAVYIRTSTEEQSEMFGEEVQKTAIYHSIDIKALTGEITRPEKQNIYIDNISGTTRLQDRPAFSRLMEDVKLSKNTTDKLGIIYVYKLDRFARKLKILLDVVDFCEENNLKFVSTIESIDTTTPFGRAMIGIMGVIAELEIETIKERTHAGREESIKKGFLMTYKYGYKKDEYGMPTLEKSEAKIIKDIFDKFVNKNYTIQKIATFLRDTKAIAPLYSKSKSEKRLQMAKNSVFFWHSSTIRKILTDEFYIGKYYYNKSSKGKALPKTQWKLSPFAVPIIINLITYKKAQDKLINYDKYQKRNNNSKNFYLLSSLLKCECCYNRKMDQSRITWHGTSKKAKNNKTSRYYQCGRKNRYKGQIECPTIPIPSDELENYIIKQITRIISNPKEVFDYQLNLQSSKLEQEKLIQEIINLNDMINGIPIIKERYKEQEANGLMELDELERKLSEETTRYERLMNEKRKLEVQVTQYEIDNGYYGVLEEFKNVYLNRIQEIIDNKAEKNTLSDIIHLLIEEIIIFSRPTNEKDTIAGKKKSNQQIPYKIQIKFKLPSEILNKLYSSRSQDASKDNNESGNGQFLVKKSIW